MATSATVPTSSSLGHSELPSLQKDDFPVDTVEVQTFFQAVKANDVARVRQMLAANRNLAITKMRDNFVYPRETELSAMKFLGAYIGSMSPLHYSILLSHESIAMEIIDSTFAEHIDSTYGGENTALHLAAFLGENEIVKALLERNAKKLKNRKGFTPLDIVDDGEIQETFVHYSAQDPNGNEDESETYDENLDQMAEEFDQECLEEDEEYDEESLQSEESERNEFEKIKVNIDEKITKILSPSHVENEFKNTPLSQTQTPTPTPTNPEKPPKKSLLGTIKRFIGGNNQNTSNGSDEVNSGRNRNLSSLSTTSPENKN